MGFYSKIAPKLTIIPEPLEIRGRRVLEGFGYLVLEGFGGLQNFPEYPLNPLNARRYLIA